MDDHGGNTLPINHWRPISASELHIPASHQFPNVANIESIKKFHLHHFPNQRTQFFRHINTLIPPAMQYRNPYPHFSKPDNAKLNHQKPSTYFIKGGASISYSKFPSNAIQNIAPGVKPPIYVKQELSSSNSQFNGIHSATPVLYKAFPVFKSTGNSAGGNHDLTSLSTSHPMWMQSYTSSPKTQLMFNEANLASRTLPGTGQSISSYSFFSPASRLVRIRPTVESLSSSPDLNKSRTSTKLSLAVHTMTPSEEKKHAYTKFNSTPTLNHFWGDSEDLPQLTQELHKKKLLPYKPSINRPIFTELNQQFVNDDFKFSEPITFSPLINSGNVSNISAFHSKVFSPFDKDLKILDHGLISTKASTPIKNTEIKTTEIFLPDDKLFPLNILFTTADPKALKITDLEEMAQLNYSQIRPLSNRINQFSPIITEDYTSRHNFFTIQDAITFPPYTSSTREANFTTQDVVSNYTSRSTTENCFNKKFDSTEISTKPSQAQTVFISSKTKARRRRPQMRSKNTSLSIPNSTEHIKKQAFLTSFNTTDATNGPIKTINQRKNSRLSITEIANSDFTTHISLIPQNTEINKKNKSKIYGLREVSGTDDILPEQTYLQKSNTSLSQTTPSSIKYLYTLTTLSQDDFKPTTFITTTPSQQNFNLKNIYIKLNNSSDNTTKDDSFLQKSLPDSNVERGKTVRHRYRLRSETTKAGMKETKSVPIIYEGKDNLNTSSIENATKVLPLEAISNLQVKRPTFSVKEFKTRHRVQNRIRNSTTTTVLPDSYPITLASINSDRLQTRKRLLPMMRIKPIGYNISTDSKNEAKLKEVNRDTTKPTIQKDRVDKTTESLRGNMKLQSVNRKSLQKSNSASNFTSTRKKTTRPQYNNSRDRIHKFQHNKMKTHDSLDFSDDLLNITVVKSDHDTVSSEIPKLQTAIMKIAKQNNSRKALQMLADPKTVSVENVIKSDTEKSEQVSLLTIGSSQSFSDKKSNAIFRQIPEYFAIATDDPILPIEAFFPNFKTINQSNNT